MPAMQEVVAVEGVDVGVGSPKGKNQVHFLVKVVKSGPARTSKVISLPSALATRARMEICSAFHGGYGHVHWDEVRQQSFPGMNKRQDEEIRP